MSNIPTISQAPNFSRMTQSRARYCWGLPGLSPGFGQVLDPKSVSWRAVISMAAQSAKTAVAAPETLGILRKGSLGEWGKLRIPIFFPK